MSTVTDRLSGRERGQRVGHPDRPLESYEMYHKRTLRWRALAQDAHDIVAREGPEAARKLLNAGIDFLDLGVEAIQMPRRFMPELGRMAVLGQLNVPGGCAWATTENGRCTFCMFQEPIDAMVGDLRISDEEFTLLGTCGMTVFEQAADYAYLFTGGSGIYEIPDGTQRYLSTRVAMAPRLHGFGFESRVQYVTPERLLLHQEILAPAGKTLTVMYGVETAHEKLRNGPLLNKGMTDKGLERAVRITLDAQAWPAGYLILKPVEHMTEAEAIADCIATIRFIINMGMKEAMVQARYDTPKCPWLWSITHVLWETRDLQGKVTLGDWRGEIPPPQTVPRNCGACDEAVITHLERFRTTLDHEHVNPAHLPECPNNCRARWAEEVGL